MNRIFKRKRKITEKIMDRAVGDDPQNKAIMQVLKKVRYHRRKSLYVYDRPCGCCCGCERRGTEMTDAQKAACGEIAAHYGLMAQKNQTYQELAKLTCILSKREDQKGADYTDRVADKIADCLIVIEQMRQLRKITSIEINDRISYKLMRQKDCIAKEGNDE